MSVRMIVRVASAGSRVTKVPIGTFAGACGNAQFAEPVQAAVVGGKAHADVEFLVGIVGPVGAQLDAVGHQLDDAADQRNVGAKLGGLGPVDLQAPLDAGQRPRVLGIDHAGIVETNSREFVHGVAKRVQRG